MYFVDSIPGEEMIEVLYNVARGGGMCISDKALDMFTERKTQKDPSWKEHMFDFDSCRTDPCLIEIYKELGPKQYNDEFSNVYISSVPKRYKDFIEVSYADEYEHLHVNLEKYKLACIRDIVVSDMNNDEKIEKMKEFLTV